MNSKYFSPSVNILRDRNSLLNYIPTRNGERAFQKIMNAASHGTKSFSIIGAYGSGKSAFILALEKALNKKTDYFQDHPFIDLKEFKATFIIGEYSSFKESFCEKFNLNKDLNILDQLKSIIESDHENKIGHLIVIDEFGKFLEYIAKESPEDELYFIQQVAEFVNSAYLPVIFITTLHQAFEDYALSLNKIQKKEWEKVNGRLLEVSFNEPVEQLLFLAAERISQKLIPCKIKSEDQKILFDSIQNSEAFPLREYFSFEFAKKIFPFDILSASIATIAFQRYGQNERSLFTFLESDDYLGFNDFIDGREYFNIAHVYDYLKYNFHSLINSRFNPDSVHWKVLDESLQRAESIFDKDYEAASQILKTIGLLSIMGRSSQKITKEFLVTYANIALGISDPEKIIDILEVKQIIRYRNFSHRYILFRGTDFDITQELENAEGQVSRDFSIAHNLKKHFNFPVISAKRYSYITGTPRYFVFEISENPITKAPEGQVDGYINLIFNNLLDFEKLKETSLLRNEAILYGYVNSIDELKQQLIEIEKIQLVLNKCFDDQIASSELNSYLKAAQNKLNSLLFNSFFGQKSNITWVYNGITHIIQNNKELNLLLSQICNDVYFATPVFKNELMNRQKVSGAISLAKTRLIEQLLKHIDDPYLGFDEDKFPPEKTIYLSLLNRTGIHTVIDNIGNLDMPLEQSFLNLWEHSERFLLDCSNASRKLSDFVDILKAKPFKLKQGFIDFWIPIFLIAKRKNFAFYEDGIFIPDLTGDTIAVAIRQPQKYFISTFHLDDNRLRIFNKYREFLNLSEEEGATSDSFIETVKPFLSFYRRLVPYVQKTRNLSKEALRLKESISIATSPEKIFFEDIPRALNYTINDFDDESKIRKFSEDLQGATRELSSAFPGLMNRLEKYINETIRDENLSFPDNKYLLQERYKAIKNDQVEPKLRSLLQRINTPLDDRNSWIGSIASLLLGKTPDKFNDEEEETFKRLIRKRLYDLDNLTDISANDIDNRNEEVLKLEVTSFVKGVQRNLIRLPKQKMQEIEKHKDSFKQLMNDNDKQTNIAILIKLLQEEIENE